MKKSIQFIKMHGAVLLTIFVGILVGILLLINPAKYAIAIIRIAGLLLIALAVFDFLKYFRTKPEEAARGSGFYTGMTDKSCLGIR